jgi:hypothetical protein
LKLFNNRSIRKNGFHRTYNRLPTDRAILRIVIFILVVFDQVQDKYHVRGGQSEIGHHKDKQYYPEAIFHFCIAITKIKQT